MKLLLDEMLAPEVARILRARGHDAVAIKQREEWISCSDDEVMTLAREARRAVVTSNVRDFRPRAAAASLPGGAGHYGLICVPASYRRTRADIGRLVEALEGKLAAFPGERDLHNQETWL